MKSELVMAINQICSERNLAQEVIIEAIETSLVSAYKKNYGVNQNIKATIDMKTGLPAVFIERIVVEEVQDDRFEISLKDARKQVKDAKLGAIIQIDITPDSFGRIAAQTAKQVILQRIREAERDALFSSYADREGELLTGVIASVTSYAVSLNLGRTEAVMPRSQQVPKEHYRVGQRVRAYVMEVRRTNRGPQIVVSRTHRNMLRRMLELEVPEIFNGTVEIKSISREAGSRSKVAVAAQQEGVDPVGSCVGIRGMRIQSIVNELGGEKIDVVEWSADSKVYISNSLSPARVSYVVLDERANPRTATVVVPDDQLSLAIGKEGQNARLAAKLTGWRIDIKSESLAKNEEIRPQQVITMAEKGEKDILAMAEAILLGKVAAPKVEQAQLEEEEEPEPFEMEGVAEAATMEEPAVEVAVAGITDMEAAAVETAAVETTPIEAAVELSVQPESLEQEELAAKEKETRELAPVVSAPASAAAAPTPQGKPAPKGKKSRYVFVEDEEMASLRTPQKKQRRKRHEVVRDDTSGALVIKRKHKREGTDGIDWEDVDH